MATPTGDNDAYDAEMARQEHHPDHPGGALEPAHSVKVKALVPVSGADGKTHKGGTTFTTSEASVADALARGLVEHVEDKRGS